MATSLAFLLDKSVEHLERGLEQQRRGNPKEASFSYLQAADSLLRAARQSEPPFKDKRLERAETIAERGRSLASLAAQKKGATARPEAETIGTDTWLVHERPKERLADVAGLEEAKEQILIKMIYPFTHPDQAQKYGIKKGGGILLYGPPGTGKTMIAKAVAGEIEAAFYTVKPSEIMSKWVGEAEQNVAKLFAAARSTPRSVIFIDEVEALAPRRRDSHSTVMQRVVPQILAELEGFSSRQDASALLFIAATNEPWSLDEAILRPGRLDERLYIPLPDFPARRHIIEANMKGKPLAQDVDLDEVARLSNGYSGADLRRVCEKAGDIPFLESVRTGQERSVEMRDLVAALQSVKPSVSSKAVERFERFAQEGT